MSKESEGIVGDGDIGSFLKEHDKARADRIYFASGVSNSQETRESEYQREKDLLLEQDRDKRLIYFGSLSIFYSDGRYAQHKREMEELIMAEFPKYTIVRIGNITWGNNPHTLINYLRARVHEGKPIELRDETRYVADSEEFLHWIDMIPDGFNCEINIPGKRMKVTEIFEEYVLHDNKK